MISTANGTTLSALNESPHCIGYFPTSPKHLVLQRYLRCTYCFYVAEKNIAFIAFMLPAGRGPAPTGSPAGEQCSSAHGPRTCWQPVKRKTQIRIRQRVLEFDLIVYIHQGYRNCLCNKRIRLPARSK